MSQKLGFMSTQEVSDVTYTLEVKEQHEKEDERIVVESHS